MDSDKDKAMDIDKDKAPRGAKSLHDLSLAKAVTEFQDMSPTEAVKIFSKLEAPQQEVLFQKVLTRSQLACKEARNANNDLSSLIAKIPVADYNAMFTIGSYRTAQREVRNDDSDDIRLSELFRLLVRAWDLDTSYTASGPFRARGKPFTLLHNSLIRGSASASYRYTLCSCKVEFSLPSTSDSHYMHKCQSGSIHFRNVISTELLLYRLVAVFCNRAISKAFSNNWDTRCLLCLSFVDGSVSTFTTCYHRQQYHTAYSFVGCQVAKDCFQIMLNFIINCEDPKCLWEIVDFAAVFREDLISLGRAMMEETDSCFTELKENIGPLLPVASS